jgi:putative phosphonate metabolism protein
MSARYAIYYTPAPESALWRLGSAWFGRDSYTDTTVPRPNTPEISDVDLDEAIIKPARYGFHATLFAPFELAPACDEAELSESFASFCGDWSALSANLEVNRLHDFLALISPEQTPALDALAAACVHQFDRFRAPLSDFDITRRDTPALSAQERILLKRWGYPHVLEAFRFHLSLTGALPDSSIKRLQPVLTSLFAETIKSPTAVDGLTLSKQPDRNSPFCSMARHRFTNA